MEGGLGVGETLQLLLLFLPAMGLGVTPRRLLPDLPGRSARAGARRGERAGRRKGRSSVPRRLGAGGSGALPESQVSPLLPGASAVPAAGAESGLCSAGAAQPPGGARGRARDRARPSLGASRQRRRSRGRGSLCRPAGISSC